MINIKTSRGIYHNLNETTYKYELDELIFYFSSEFNLKRFKNNVKDYVDLENFKLMNKYRLQLNLSNMLSIAYYKKIEKRGFRVEYSYKNINETTLISDNINILY